MSNNNYKNFTDKSVSELKRSSKDRKKQVLKNSVIVLASALIIGAGAYATSLLPSKMDKLVDGYIDKEIAHYQKDFDNYSYQRVSDQKMVYDHEGIAKILVNELIKDLPSEQTETIAMYNTYSKFLNSPARQEIQHMDKVFGKAKTLYPDTPLIQQLPDNFNEYLTNKGYIAEDGNNLDIDAWTQDARKAYVDKMIQESNDFRRDEINSQERGR